MKKNKNKKQKKSKKLASKKRRRQVQRKAARKGSKRAKKMALKKKLKRKKVAKKKSQKKTQKKTQKAVRKLSSHPKKIPIIKVLPTPSKESAPEMKADLHRTTLVQEWETPSEREDLFSLPEEEIPAEEEIEELLGAEKPNQGNPDEDLGHS